MISFRLPARIALLVLVTAVLYSFFAYRGSIMPPGASPSPILNYDTSLQGACASEQVLRVAIYPGGGFAPGIVANGGFRTANESIYAKEEKIRVEFIIQENPHNCFRLLRENEADIVWSDVVTFKRLYTKYQSIHPTAVMLYGFSSGEEIIVSKNPITAFDAVSNQTVIACEKWSNAYYFILSILKENGIEPHSVRWRYTLSDYDALDQFFKGKSDFAAVTSHSKTDAAQKYVIFSSSRSSMLLPGFFVTREGTIIEKKEQLVKFASGWFKGLEEMRKNREDAQKLLSQAFGVDHNRADCYLNSFICAGMKENFEFFNMELSRTPGFERAIEMVKDNVAEKNGSVPIAMMRNTDIMLAFTGQKKINSGIFPAKPYLSETTLEKFIKDYHVNFKAGEYALDIVGSKMLEKFSEKAIIFRDAKIFLSGAVATREAANYNYTWGMRFYSVKKYLVDSGISESRIILQTIVQNPVISDASIEAIICSLGP